MLDNLLRKKEYLNRGSEEHKSIKTCLIILGGGMKGIYGAGSCYALHMLGLAECFDVVVGVSTGAGIGAYFLCPFEKARLGFSIYYEELASRKFINYFRRPIVDIDFFETLLRDKEEGIDLNAITKSRSDFFTVVTDFQTGEGRFINAKGARSNLVSLVKASVALPFLYDRPVKVDEGLFMDGSCSWPFPLKEVMEKFSPTDILVLPNYAEADFGEWKHPLLEKLLSPVVLRNYPVLFQGNLANRVVHFNNSMNLLKGLRGVNIEFLWPPDNLVKLLTRDSHKLRIAADSSVAHTLKLFGDERDFFL